MRQRMEEMALQMEQEIEEERTAAAAAAAATPTPATTTRTFNRPGVAATAAAEPAPAQSGGEAAAPRKFNRQPRAAEPVTEQLPPPLPPPWQEYTHDDGRKYYYNPETRETSWHRPAPAQPPLPMPPMPPAPARTRQEILRRASCSAGGAGCGAGGGAEPVDFECTVHRNQCGLGIEVSDDNCLLSIHPEGGAAASGAGLQPGDLIVALNGRPLTDPMRLHIDPTMSSVHLVIRRAGGQRCGSGTGRGAAPSLSSGSSQSRLPCLSGSDAVRDHHIDFECTVHRNQCGLGIKVSDDNRLLSIHPEGGAAATNALQARTPPLAPGQGPHP